MPEQRFIFGTVGSPHSTPKKGIRSINGVVQIKNLHLNAIELGWVRSVRISEETCGLIRNAAYEHQIAVSVHAPYFINLNADAEEWPKSRKRLMDAAHFGNLAGATDVVFHPGSYFGNPPEEVLPIAIERLAGCVEELRDADNPVVLRPETMGKASMLGSLQDTLVMSEAIPGVEPCLDFAHLHARYGDGGMNTYEEWAAALQAYADTLGEAALKRLHTHLSGIQYGPKGERKHIPLVEADISVEAIFQALMDFDCQGRILCEGPGEHLEGDALVLQNRWRELCG